MHQRILWLGQNAVKTGRGRHLCPSSSPSSVVVAVVRRRRRRCLWSSPLYVAAAAVRRRRLPVTLDARCAANPCGAYVARAGAPGPACSCRCRSLLAARRRGDAKVGLPSSSTRRSGMPWGVGGVRTTHPSVRGVRSPRSAKATLKGPLRCPTPALESTLSEEKVKISEQKVNNM